MERAVEEAADQSVYVYQGSVMIAHLPPNSHWSFEESAQGQKLIVYSWSLVRNQYAVAFTAEAGEWTYCGRGVPGQAGQGDTWLTGKGPTQAQVDAWKRERGM